MGNEILNAFAKNILATVIAAAIVANVTVLWQISERLARVETKLDYWPQPQLVKK